MREPTIQKGVALTRGLVGEQALNRRLSDIVPNIYDTGVVDIDRRGGYDDREYWEPIARAARRQANSRSRRILYSGVERGACICRRIYAAEMVPLTHPLVGEFRVHYAGFFDPGFGL